MFPELRKKRQKPFAMIPSLPSSPSSKFGGGISSTFFKARGNVLDVESVSSVIVMGSTDIAEFQTVAPKIDQERIEYITP